MKLSYGQSTVELFLEEEALSQVLQPEGLSPLQASGDAVRSCLRNPSRMAPLRSFVKSGERVTIVVSDYTRLTGARRFLPVLLSELYYAGVSEQRVTILFGGGTHRRQTPEERKNILGEDTFKRISSLDHDASDAEQHEEAGKTSFGTRVFLNKQVTGADKVIVTGAVSYHYYAGFTGGRKGLLPGVASFDTVQENHSLVLNREPGSGLNPKARRGVLQGNPVSDDMCEGSRFVADKVFLLNTVLNDDGDIAAVFGGNLSSAHEEGCDFVKKHFYVQVKEKADLVIVSAGGFPKDVVYYQAHKALDNVIGVVRQGGAVILLAQCSQGAGSPEFFRWFSYGSTEAIERQLRRQYRVAGHTACAHLKKTAYARVVLVSELPEDEVKALSMIPAKSLQEAMGIARDFLGGCPKTYVVPDGSVTVCEAQKK